MKTIVYYCEQNRTDMTKTIREWFDELPEPQRSQAIENMHKTLQNKVIPSLSMAIRAGFQWSGSTQGFIYWRNIAAEILDKESKQSQP